MDSPPSRSNCITINTRMGMIVFTPYNFVKYRMVAPLIGSPLSSKNKKASRYRTHKDDCYLFNLFRLINGFDQITLNPSGDIL